MNIFIAGATGVLGRRLIAQFRTHGHAVIGLSRSEKNDSTIRSLGREPRAGDLFDSDSLARAAEGSEVVIHAATAIPTGSRTRPEDWKMNDRIRRDGTGALAAAVAKIGVGLFLVQSITWIVRPADESAFDEDSPYTSDPLIQSALDMERIARDAGEARGFRVAILRGGWFHSADSAHTRAFGQMLAARKMPIIGKGDGVWSFIHVDDFARAFVVAAEAGKPGVWHVTDNEPVKSGDYLRAFARRIDAPDPRHPPAWRAKLAAGSYAVKFLTSSTRTSNARFRRDFGWDPEFPTFREALDEIVGQWRTEAFLGLEKQIAA
jgi:nucleoside-diphosphate-sugar epimerase